MDYYQRLPQSFLSPPAAGHSSDDGAQTAAYAGNTDADICELLGDVDTAAQMKAADLAGQPGPFPAYLSPPVDQTFMDFSGQSLAPMTATAAPGAFPYSSQLSDDSDERLKSEADGAADGTLADHVLTAQKRKAQNRAAQRAFRERREQRVRDLQEQLDASTKNSATVQAENAMLRRELENLVAELRTLKESRSPDSSSPPAKAEPAAPRPLTVASFPSREDLDGRVEYQANASPPPGRLLRLEEIWERIMADPDSEDIDINAVVNRIIKRAICSGSGPVFAERDVDAEIAAAKIAAAKVAGRA
ncbi:uncharacterized protein V1510DRAFT_420443 [Dipodascopsis tothii]|uniref:uncharacterized protein n=1 Tax=Dipodascopsis tothii TaxID=44089 RepID=UPI0034CD9B69